jgi:hypothetical protein
MSDDSCLNKMVSNILAMLFHNVKKYNIKIDFEIYDILFIDIFVNIKFVTVIQIIHLKLTIMINESK